MGTMVLLGVGVLGACKTAAPATGSALPTPAVAKVVVKPEPTVLPEPVFVAPAVAASALVGSMVAVAPGKIQADLDALSERLGLPVKLGQQLLSSLGSLGFPGGSGHLQEVLNRLDPASPIAIVWVLAEKSAVKGFCAALTFRAPLGATQTFDEMGSTGAKGKGVFERRVENGDVIWGGIKGRTLFISGSAEALLFAGGLAEAAQLSPPSGQIAFTVLPQALAKASGKTPDAIVAQLVAAMSAATAQDKSKPALQRVGVAGVVAAARLGLASSALHLNIEVGPRDGLAVRADLVPVPGTDFAKQCTVQSPYTFDASLPVNDDATAVFALGDLWPMLRNLGPVVEASGPSGQVFWPGLDQVVRIDGWPFLYGRVDPFGLSFVVQLCPADGHPPSRRP